MCSSDLTGPGNRSAKRIIQDTGRERWRTSADQLQRSGCEIRPARQITQGAAPRSWRPSRGTTAARPDRGTDQRRGSSRTPDASAGGPRPISCSDPAVRSDRRGRSPRTQHRGHGGLPEEPRQRDRTGEQIREGDHPGHRTRALADLCRSAAAIRL